MQNYDRKSSSFTSRVCNCRVHIHQRGPDSSEPLGCVLLLHGLGDHSERHEKVADLISEAGYQVTAFDWPGNGRSGRKRGDFPLLPEARGLLREVVSLMPEPPVGVFAHSTGGFIILHTLLREMSELSKVRWLWLSSPLLSPAQGQPLWKVKLASRVVRWFPRLTVSTGVKVTDCFSVTPNRHQIAKTIDIRSHNRITLRFAIELMREEEILRESYESMPPDVELFLTQGTEDKVCPYSYAAELFRRISFLKKTFCVIHNAYHEPLRQPDPYRIHNAIRNWLKLESHRAIKRSL